MNPISLSLKSFLYIFLSILVILPLLIVGGISIYVSSAVLRKEIVDSSRREISIFSERIDHYLRTPVDIVSAMAEMVEEGDPQQIIQSYTENFDILDSVHIADSDGIVIAHYPPDELFDRFDVSGHDYFRVVKKSGELYWSPTFISEQLDVPVTSLSYPLEDGVLTATLSLEAVMNMIDDSQSGGEGLIYYVTDQNGVYIAHTEREKVILQEYDSAQIDYRLGKLESLVEQIEYKGIEYIANYSIVESSGWMVALLQPQKAIDGPVESMVWSLLLLTVIVLGLTVMMGLLLLRNLTLPLTSLTFSTKAISNGSYKVKSPPARIKELSHLGQSIEVMARDIESREVELNGAYSYLTAVINSLPSIIIGVDRQLRITRINSYGEEAGSVREEEVLGKSLPDFLPRLSGEVPFFTRAIEEQRMDVSTKETFLKTGRRIIESISIYPLAYPGLQGAVIRIDDITEKSMMEEILIHNEKMLSIGGLAAGMAHEINNPLAGMIQTANVLAGRLGFRKKIPANEKAASSVGISIDNISRYMELRDIPGMIESLNKSGQRISSIVNNMLSFVRTGQENVSTHNINEILDLTIELAQTDYNLRKKYDFRKIEIVRNYGENLPSVLCETSKVQQVFFNILQNGAHAMSPYENEEPKIIISTSFDSESSMVVVEITDNGPGMEESVRRRIFEPFFTTKPVGLGTGLGLSVSYFIITENQKGEMFVESSPGEGATFIIKLPSS